MKAVTDKAKQNIDTLANTQKQGQVGTLSKQFTTRFREGLFNRHKGLEEGGKNQDLLADHLQHSKNP